MYMILDQVVDCERGNRVRARKVYLLFFGGVLFSVCLPLLWYHSQWPLTIMLLAVGAALLAQSMVNGVVLEDTDKPHWR